MKAKKLIAVVLAAAFAASLASCANKNQDNDETNNAPSQNSEQSIEDTSDALAGGLQVVNPLKEHNSIKDAADELGFDISLPEAINGIKQSNIFTISGTIIEARYYSDDNGIYLRKAKTADESEDISGDYNEYEKTQTLKLGDSTVTIKGDDTGIMNATWTINEFSYSIVSDIGLSQDIIEGIVSQVK